VNREFTLSNEPAHPTPTRFESNGKTRQKVLLCGLNCLPGQLDLFPTDGCERAEDEQSDVRPVQAQDGK